MLEVSHLTKYYGDKLGVEDVSFSVAKGEIVGLLGPNGAGKSTIMKMIAGYHAPSSGTVTVGGFDVVESPREAARHIGFLPEIPPLYPDMAVEEYLSFLAQIRGVAKKERRAHVDEVMELANISHVKTRLIRNLSKGYRQRVGLAQALVSLPELLILDEPTVGLDPKQITEVRDLIKRLSLDHTVILSSHILSEISAICERIVIINRGHLVAEDTMEGLAARAEGGDSFLLRVKDPAGRAQALFAGLENAAGVEALDGGEDGCRRFTLTAKPGAPLREEVFRLCAGEDLPILEMRTLGASLEDVFLSLTSDGAAGAPEEEAP